MVIEDDAWWFIKNAIDQEKVVLSEETNKFTESKSEEDRIKMISKINSVANPEGKGRDDLSI